MIISGSEVGGPVRIPVGARPAGSKGVGSSHGTPPASGNGAADGVSVSDGAQQIAGWISAIGALPDVRAARVAEVVARLQSGQRPSGVDVAASILRQGPPQAVGGR